MARGRTAQPRRPVQRASKAAVTVAKKRGVTPGRGCFAARLRSRGLGFLCGLTVWQGRGCKRTFYPKTSQVTRESAGGGSIGRGPKYGQSCGLETVACPVSTLLPVADSFLVDEGVHSRGPGVASVGATVCPTSAVPLRLRKHQTRTREGERRGAVGCFGLTV